jgi:hypothetical protein
MRIPVFQGKPYAHAPANMPFARTEYDVTHPATGTIHKKPAFVQPYS